MQTQIVNRTPAIWEPRVSYFLPPIENVLPSRQLLLREVYQKISGDELKELTQELRNLEEKEKIRQFKATRLPYVTFSGTFRSRNAKALLEDSQLYVLDLDHLEDPEGAKKLLLQDKFFDTRLLFFSPSGKGIKWVIRQKDRFGLNRIVFYRALDTYLQRTYGLKIDLTGSDVARASFLCHDPECVYKGD